MKKLRRNKSTPLILVLLCIYDFSIWCTFFLWKYYSASIAAFSCSNFSKITFVISARSSGLIG